MELRARHETCNRRFKVFGLLKQQFRGNNLKQHGWVFRSVVALVQLGIDHGDCLFGCEPMTKKKAFYGDD